MKKDDLFGLHKEVLEIRDRHPQISFDNAFVSWFLRAFIVDNEDVAVEALKGGPSDKGVDAIYLDHDARTVFVLQGKYRVSSKPSAEKRSDVIALADLWYSLLSQERSGFHALLQDAEVTVKNVLEKARNLIIKRNYRLVLQFVTTGKVSDELRGEAINRFDYLSNASFQVFSRDDLVRLMQDYIEGASPPVPTISLQIHGEQLFNRFDQKTGISSWVFTMSGQDLGKLYNDIGDRLFARNIRGFLGNTDINLGMSHTLKNEPEYFWYFNNGVTIICDEARQITERGRKNLRVTNGQIINGQQTTRILSLRGDSDSTVLVKVIVVPRNLGSAHDHYGHLVGQIVSATNWQNAISQSDLKSNDVEQVRLERDLRKIGYQYLRKRQTKTEARRIAGNRYRYIIKKETLAQYIGACLLDPYEVRLGKDRLFEDDVYSTIFNGRPATEYITFYWLGDFASYISRGDIRRSYAKWLVLNFLWNQIGNPLQKITFRENFRYSYERYYKFSHEFKPLRSSIEAMFKAAMLFYRLNKNVKGGIFDESTFFKHKSLHYKFEKFWKSSKNPKRDVVSKRLKKFIKNMQGINTH